MKTFKIITALTLASSLFIACKKETTEDDHDHTTPVTPTPTTPAATTGGLTFKFTNSVGVKPMVLNTENYVNNTDSFTVSTFNYFISNIKLTATDGTVFSETESYHLLKADDAASLQFSFANVPVKNYSSITFMIGVDSLRNVSGAQTGALDPASGMFWTWNSGYIMAKFEGNSPKSTNITKLVEFHIGGFKGTNSVLKTVTLPLTTNATITGTITPVVEINADLAEWFAPNAISFAMTSSVTMPGAMAKKIADNYANMFTITKVTN
jgi:hypothetical protein